MVVRKQGPGSHPTWGGQKDVSLGYAAPQVGQRGGDGGPKLRARVGLQIGSRCGSDRGHQRGERTERRGERTEPDGARGGEGKGSRTESRAAMSRASVTEAGEESYGLHLPHASSFWHLLMFVSTALVQVTTSSSLNYRSRLLAVPYGCPGPCAGWSNSHDSSSAHYTRAFVTLPRHGSSPSLHPLESGLTM